MDDELASWAAEQLGRVSRMRVEVAEAIDVGDYESAIRISEEAFELSRLTLERLADVDGPETSPHEAMAFATLSDITVARAAVGRPDPEADSGLASLQSLLLLGRTGARPPETAMARRSCPHGRFTYDGHCLKKPPCPGI